VRAARRGLISFGKVLTKFDRRELGGITVCTWKTSKNHSDYRFFHHVQSDPSSDLFAIQNPSQKQGCGEIGDVSAAVPYAKKNAIEKIKIKRVN
jgi:hypothetical protein